MSARPRTMTAEREAYLRDLAQRKHGKIDREWLAELDAERAVSKALAEALEGCITGKFGGQPGYVTTLAISQARAALAQYAAVRSGKCPTCEQLSLRERNAELEAQIAGAWKEAKQVGEEFGISAEHLDALICGIGDKACEQLHASRNERDRALSELAEAREHWTEAHRIAAEFLAEPPNTLDTKALVLVCTELEAIGAARAAIPAGDLASSSNALASSEEDGEQARRARMSLERESVAAEACKCVHCSMCSGTGRVRVDHWSGYDTEPCEDCEDGIVETCGRCEYLADLDRES